MPEIVETIYDSKYLGIRQTEIIPLLVEGIRELDDRMKTNSNQIEFELLRSEINNLKVRIERLELVQHTAMSKRIIL